MGLKNRVLFIENISRNDLINLYLLSDVFALPNSYEGFGIVFLEAMAAGLPIVATNIPPINEILEHEKTALLCEPAPQSFATEIQRLLTDKRLHNKFSENGKKVCKKKYDIEEVKSKLWALYKTYLE